MGGWEDEKGFFNPIIALQMLIFNAAGLQIRPSAED